MGVGAGYKITSKDIYVEGRVTKAAIVGKDYLGDPLILCDCDMKGKIGSLRASSYYYSTEEIEDTDFVVKKALITYNNYYDISAEKLVNSLDELTEIVLDDLNDGSIDFIYGGGWTHTTWDGSICSLEDSLKNAKRTDYNYFYIDNANFVAAIEAKVTDERIIKYVDKAVQGENFDTQYIVYDEDSDLVDEYDTEEEAVKECREHGVGSYVEKVNYYYNADGEFDLDDFESEREVIYEKDDVDESLNEADEIENDADEQEQTAPSTIKLRTWYVDAFPNDEAGYEINEEATFDDLLKAINDGADVYEVIGVKDSIIRERLFDKLSDITGISYDDLYEKWYSSANKGKE